MKFTRSLFRRVLLVSLAACMAVLLLIVAVAGFIVHAFAGNAIFPADCAIVFGTAVRTVRDERGVILANTAGPGITRRVQTAARLYREGNIKRLFLSGGIGEGMPESEAAVMRRLALSEGVQDADIVVEDQSTSTRENLIFTRPLLDECQSTVAVSDRYHLGRIRMIAALQGMALYTFPADRHADRAFETWSVIREVGGVILAPFGR